MAKLRPNRVTTAFALLFVLFTPHQSWAEDKCRSGCQGGASKTFKYSPGTTYKYNLEGGIEILLSSAEGQQTNTKLKATVLLTQLPDCNQLLRLKDVQVIGPDAKKYGHLAGIEKPIQLNFHDGHIEDIICAEPDDNQNSLNIKRAVASLFQVAPKHSHETDVFGVCPTDISKREDGNVVIVQKSKSLNKCGHRESISNELLSTTFNLNSEIKSSPLLDGDYSSEQQIKNGILEKALVTESYLFLPFSVGKNGAQATVSTKIQLVGQSSENPGSKVSEPKSIIFDNPHPVNTEKVNLDSILTALKDAKKTIDQTVGEESASEFLNLVKTLRVSSKNDLLAVYRQVRAGAGFQDKVGAKKVFLDALFRAGTGETIEVAIELLKNKELTPLEQKLLYLRLAFVGHATPGSLTASASLLDQPNLPREAYLSIGSIAGIYCRQHPCEKVDAVNKLSQKLVSKVKGGKPQNREEEREQLYALKALGNIGSLIDPVSSILITIAQDKKEPTRIRVASLETLQTDPCKDKIRDAAISILKDIQQDSEVRIKAYLILAQCPNGKAANVIKSLLDNEPSYQVGGFIVSHIRNLKASTNPDKELAKQQLGNINTSKKFPFDIRKYSFNTEFSYAIDTLGLANSVEGNIIYSQSSFLPRSLDLNLTADLFGHTFNFLEISSRQENLDKVLEHYYGPSGLFRSTEPEELFTKGKEEANSIYNQIKQRYNKLRRTRRDVPKSEVDKIEKDIRIKTNELNTDLDLDYSVKLFGSELLFLNIHEDVEKFKPEVLIEKFFDGIEAGLDKTKNFQEHVQSNLVFLDTELSYPTSLGFPLRLAVEGASSVLLKVEGNIDVQSLLSSSADKQFKLKVLPSANIEIAGSLSIDTQVVESGLKVKTSLYTATGTDLSIELSKIKGIDVKFSLPVRDQKIVSASHQILFNSRELGKKEVTKPLKFSHNKQFSICFDNLSPYIGLAFCADINTPSQTGKQAPLLPFPFSGNTKLSVGIEREDLSEFHLRSTPYADSSKNGIDFVFEVVGEKGNKKLSVEAEAFIVPETYVRGSIKAAEKTLLAEAKLVNTNNEKSISAKVRNDDQEYYGRVGFAVSGSPQSQVYKPIFDYKLPGGAGQGTQSSVEGTITAQRSGTNVKYIFNDIKLNIPNKNLLLKGNVAHEGSNYLSDITVSDGEKDASLKGRLQLSPSIVLDAEFKNSVNPQANVDLKAEFKKSAKEVEALLQLIHGHDLSSKTNKLVLSAKAEYRFKDYNDFFIKYEDKFSYPLIGTEASFEFESSPKTLKYDFDFKYNQVNFGSELDAKVNKKTVGDYDIELEVYGMGNKLEVKAQRDIEGDKSKIENEIELNGKKVEVKGTINHHFQPNDIDLGANLVIKVPKVSEPIKLNSALVLNPDKLDTVLKILAGSNINVDIVLKASKDGNANGNLKVLVKDFINADGQIKATKGSGNANFVADLPKLNKKLKTESTFKIVDPVYNLVINFYPDINKDPQNKITISTENKITLTSINSENFVEALGKKLEANLKASRDKKQETDQIDVDAEVTLPSDHYFSLKLKRNVKFVSDIFNGNGLLVIEQRDNKNSPGRKLTNKVTVKDTNLKKHTLDYTNNLALELGNGNTFNSDIVLKHNKNNEDKSFSDASIKLSGSLLKHPVELSTSSNYKERVGTYKILGKCGDKASVSVNGNYDLYGQGKPISGDINIEAGTPNAVVRTVKFSSSGYAKKPESPDDYLELKGKWSLFVDDDGSKPDATVDIKTDGEVKFSRKDGQLRGSLNFQKEPPISVALGYGISDEPQNKKINGNLELKTGKGKDIKTDVTVSNPKENEYIVDLLLDAPEARGSKFHFYTKKSPDGRVHSNGGTVEVNGKKYVASNDLVLSETAPALDLSLEFPDGKKDEIVVKLNRLSSKQANGDLKIAFPQKDFLLEGRIDATVESPDDFNVKSKINSPSLKINNIDFEAQTKPAKGGNRILVSISSDGKNILSGSTSYKHRTEGNKVIVEGAGSFKVKEENKAANFKYIRQTLETEKNGEQGIQVSFNGGIGSKAVDAELKLTNKQFKILNSYCEEKKQCSNIELDSKITENDVSVFNHEIEVAIDLRNLGFPHEFGLKGVTTRKDLVFVHTVDIHLQNKNNKYQYSVYLQPTEAGISLTTPKRIVALEAKLNLPKEKGKYSPIKGDVSLYFDKKNQPNQKTSLSGEWSYDHSKDGGNAHAELKFTNPTLAKDLQLLFTTKVDLPSKTASQEIIIDVFSKPNQKIVISTKAVGKKLGHYGYSSSIVSEAKSQGLKIDIKREENLDVDIVEKHSIHYSHKIIYNLDKSKYSSVVQAEVDPKHLLLWISAFNRDLVKINSQLQLSKEAQIADTTTELLGVKPVSSHLEIKNFNTLKLYASRKDNPNEKIELNAGFIPSQISDFRLEVVKNGARNDLVHASVKLDEANFLKSDYGVSAENIRQLVLTPIKTDLETFFKEVKSTFESVSKEVSEQVSHLTGIAKKSIPNFKPFIEYHKKELDKLREEIVSDKTLKELEEFLRGIFGAALKTFNEILAQISEVTEKVVATIQNQFAVVIEAINKDLLPKINELVKSLLNVAYTVAEQFTNLFFTYLAKVSQIIDAHQDELKHIATYFSSVGQDLIQFLTKLFEQTRAVVVKESQQIYNEIKALPIAEEIKNKYNQLTSGLSLSEGFINSLRDFARTLKDAVPNPQLKEVISTLSDYIEKKLRHQPVDDVATLESIVKTIIEALKSALASLQTGKNIDISTKAIPLSFNFINNIPRLVAIKFSPLNYLLRNDIPDFISSLRLAISLEPRDFILPQRLHAIVAQGQHIFTFDGKHITFPGKCNYLLAGDAENGNFSLIGTYNNGLLTAITLSVGEDSVTLKKGRQVALNNAATDFPVSTPNVEAFATYESIQLASKAGIRVVCGPELVVCGVYVSGYYHGQLKGLLGNGNNEPYDDFTLPNGKIVTSEEEFANAYKTSGGCPNVKVVHSHGQQSQPSCNKLFGSDSPLRFCSLFVDPENFKEACNHGLQSGVADTEKAIAVAYVAACNRKNVWSHVPEEHVKCSNGDKPYDLFTKFSVKLPGKAADVILVVDQTKSTEEIYKNILQPLIPQLTQEFNANGISDVEFHLIGYNGANPKWPAHFTHGGKFTFKGKLPNLKFYQHPEKQIPQTGNEKVDWILKNAKSWLHDLALATGHNIEHFTYQEAFKYPFRANAVKSIIVARSTTCEQGRFVAVQKLLAYLFNSKEISVNLIAPLDDVKVKDPKESKNIIGFNSRYVFTTGDGKKKQGNADLHRELTYDDYCADFTVLQRGNVFIANNILAAKGANRKQSLQSAAHNIVQSVTSVEQGLDCECKPVSPYSGINVCHSVYTKEKAHAARKGNLRG